MPRFFRYRTSDSGTRTILLVLQAFFSSQAPSGIDDGWHAAGSFLRAFQDTHLYLLYVAVETPTSTPAHSSLSRCSSALFGLLWLFCRSLLCFIFMYEMASAALHRTLRTLVYIVLTTLSGCSHCACLSYCCPFGRLHIWTSPRMTIHALICQVARLSPPPPESLR